MTLNVIPARTTKGVVSAPHERRPNRLSDGAPAKKYAEQNGGENRKYQKIVISRAVKPTKLLIQQYPIASSHRGQPSNRRCSTFCWSHIQKSVGNSVKA
jgi:hypothetical protein